MISRLHTLARSLFVLCLLACSEPPIQWKGPPGPLLGPVTDASVLTVEGAPARPAAIAAPVAPPAAGLPTLGAGACLASLRWARDGPRDVAATWWVARGDSSVTLQLMRSRDDGAHWEASGIAEARDRGVRGCARPAPAVALDARSGYTHLVYFFEPTTGAGIFYEHLMELPVRNADGSTGRQAMFHAPVAIVYGETPREANVAAHGDTVVVAYEDPNAPGPEVAATVSVTGGHSFSPAVVASGVGVAARDPLAAVRDATIAVGWRETAFHTDDSGDSGSAPANHAVVRLGDLR
jgi:hypothetical protein